MALLICNAFERVCAIHHSTFTKWLSNERCVFRLVFLHAHFKWCVRISINFSSVDFIIRSIISNRKWSFSYNDINRCLNIALISKENDNQTQDRHISCFYSNIKRFKNLVTRWRIKLQMLNAQIDFNGHNNYFECLRFSNIINTIVWLLLQCIWLHFTFPKIMTLMFICS